MTLVLSVLALGVAVGLLVGPAPTHALTLLALLVAAAAAGVARLAPARPLLAAALLFCAGLMLGYGLTPAGAARGSAREPGAENSEVRGGLARVTLEIERSACGSKRCSSTANVVACEALEPGACPGARARLNLSTPSELPHGALVRLLARLTPQPSFRNRSPAYAWNTPLVELSAYAEGDGKPSLVSAGWLAQGIVRARSVVREAFVSSLAPLHAGVARALLLGEGQAVDADLNDAIRSSGVSHILAVSGMHVTVLAGAIVLALRALLLRTPLAARCEVGRLAAAAGVVLAPLVAAFAGASPSALRAAVAGAFTFLAVALGRRPQPVAIATLAFVVCAALFPRDALHPGFVLSVVATHALLTGARGSESSVLRESLRTWLATAPLLWVLFGGVQSVAVFANLAVAPVGAALIPLVALHALASLASPALGFVSAQLFEVASGAFLAAAKWFAEIDPQLVLPPPTPLEAVVLVAFSLLLLSVKGPRELAAVTPLLLAVAAFEEYRLHGSLAAQHMRVTFLDVGQGDCALIEAEGQVIVIDAGGAPQGGPDPGARALVPLLRAHRITGIDLFVLTHPHPDHYGGLAALARALPIRELWDSGQGCAEGERGPACQLVRELVQRGTRVQGPRELCGAAPRGALKLTVLSPCPSFDETLDANDNSLVVQLTHGAQRFLFTGDIERTTEAALVARLGERLRAEVLKLGHHGSRTSTTAAFLSAVHPALAVISAGPLNRFGHPHHEVIARLQEHGVKALRTDQAGSIEILSDGRELTVTTALDSTPGALSPAR